MSNTIDEQKEHIVGVFSRAASIYDHTGPQFFRHFGRRLVELAEIAPGAKVLDIASGRGAILFPAAEQVGPDGYVIGIDLAEGMVRETTAEIKRLGFTNVEIRQMDAEQLIFPDASFDMVLCGFAIFFFPQLQPALGEIWRILKPGGRIGVTTFARDEHFEWIYDLVQSYLPNKDSDGDESDKNGPTFNTPEGVTAILAEAGFQDIRVEQEEKVFVYADEETWWAQQWSHGARGSLEQIEPEQLENLKAKIFEGFQTYQHEDGIHNPIRVLFTFGHKPRQ